MVKITKKVDYGLTLLVALAKNPTKWCSLKQVSVKYQLPYKFIGQVASELLEAGIFESKEGAGGGYRLKKKPSHITLMEIVNILDGEVVKTDCLQGKQCKRLTKCQHRWVLIKVSKLITNTLAKTTLADLCSN